MFKQNIFAPGHFELWFVGWTLLNFRNDFPLNPLPIAAFLPLLTFDHESHPEVSHDLLLDINTTTETMTFIDRKPRYKRNKSIVEKPFLPQKMLVEMQEYARNFEAEDYDVDTYNEKTAHSIKIAKDEQRSLKALRKKIKKKYKGKKHRNISRKEILEQEEKESLRLYDDSSRFTELGHLS